MKRNLNFIQDLCSHDIIFLCETWLFEEENINFLNNVSFNHSYLHCSDMLFSPSKGRPYGGRIIFQIKREFYKKKRKKTEFFVSINCKCF